MDPVKDVSGLTADYAAQFLATLEERPVRADATLDELRDALGGPLPETGRDAAQVIAELIAARRAGHLGMPSGRYFGFVIGGAVPAALAADWLTSTWDQNAGLYAPGRPRRWSRRSPASGCASCSACRDGVSVGFVTGCQMAHVTRLAAARHHVLAQAGWDVERDGLAGAPRIRVARRRGACTSRSTARCGSSASGRAPIEPVPADDAGPHAAATRCAARSRGRRADDRLRPGRQREHGRVRPARRRSPTPRTTAGAWLHVDGAFGLWAARRPRSAHLVAGVERADSWATDGHKWLNVPYDCGVAFCAHPDAHRRR